MTQKLLSRQNRRTRELRVTRTKKVLTWPWTWVQRWFWFYVKFMFSKRATKIDAIFTVDLTLCCKCQIDGEDCVSSCGLLRKHELYVREIWSVNNDKNEETLKQKICIAGKSVNLAQLRDNERTSVKWPHLQKMSYSNEVMRRNYVDSMMGWEHLKGKR